MQLDSSNLGALHTFDVAARVLNFTKAAQLLNLTQSAVSQQIRLLEERLGYALFVRQSRSLVLTPKGQILFDTTSVAFHELNKTLKRLDLSDAPLQVSCLPSFALQWLMPRLIEFHRDQPDVSVRLRAEFQTLNHKMMRVDDIDVAIRFEPAQHAGSQAEIMLDEYLIPVATPQYLARYPRFALGESMDGITLLHDAAPWVGAQEFIEWRTWMTQVKPEWLPFLGGVQFNLSSLAIGAALNHQGVAMGRAALVHEEMASGRLVNVFQAPVTAPGTYMLYCNQQDDRRTGVFTQWLKDECKRFVLMREEFIGPGHDMHAGTITAN